MLMRANVHRNCSVAPTRPYSSDRNTPPPPVDARTVPMPLVSIESHTPAAPHCTAGS